MRKVHIKGKIQPDQIIDSATDEMITDCTSLEIKITAYNYPIIGILTKPKTINQETYNDIEHVIVESMEWNRES